MVNARNNNFYEGTTNNFNDNGLDWRTDDVQFRVNVSFVIVRLKSGSKRCFILLVGYYFRN